MTRPPPNLTLFPYTTLFRSEAVVPRRGDERRAPAGMDLGQVVRRPGERVRPVVRERREHERAQDDLGLVPGPRDRSEEHTSELQSHSDLVCRLLLEKKKTSR